MQRVYAGQFLVTVTPKGVTVVINITYTHTEICTFPLHDRNNRTLLLGAVVLLDPASHKN
jgi:hypothetical protein